MTGNTIFHTEAFRIAADGRWLAPPRAVQLEGVAIDSRAPLKNLAFFAIRGERFDVAAQAAMFLEDGTDLVQVFVAHCSLVSLGVASATAARALRPDRLCHGWRKRCGAYCA